MESALSKHMGKNVKNIISSIQVVQGTAKDSGSIYYCLEISLVNGHKYRKFMRGAEEFAFVNAIEQLQTQDQLDNAF